jgi:HEAT repeat protein
VRVVRCRIVGVVCLAAAAAPIAALAEEEAAPELVQLVIDLLADRDKDVRALGLEQVRTSAQGAAATRRFAEQLPKLPPDGQAALLSALADRADPEARAAVLELLAASSDEPVRLAAIEALGFLGQATDARLLIELLSDGASAERAAARASLVRLPGDAVSSHIAAELAHAPAPLRVTSIEILAQRRAFHTVPDILPWATDADAAVRAAAMSALGELAGPEHVAGMVQGVLKAEPGPERTAAEKSIVYVCGRIEDRERRADPLIDAMNALESADRRALLPTLGRVGGQAALRIVEDAIDDPAPELHDLGLRALCHWPDASISQRLMGLVGSDEHSEHRTLALRALVRVAPLPDERSDEERLAAQASLRPLYARRGAAVCDRAGAGDPHRGDVAVPAAVPGPA